MSGSETAAVVLAAGEGKRMKSDRAKVLHAVAGLAMIDRVIGALRAAEIGRIVIVTGNREEQVKGHLEAEIKGGRVSCVTQAEQKGTGHAVMQAGPALKDFKGRVVIACGDVPLLRPETIRAAVGEFDRLGAAGVVLTTVLERPDGYGRVLRDAKGDVLRIVEHKDASEEERRVREINSGTYCFEAAALFHALGKVTNKNAQGEYYLTDVVEILLKEGKRVGAHIIRNPEEAMGVNSPEELAKAEAALVAREGAGQ